MFAFPPLPDGISRLKAKVMPNSAMILPFFESVPAGFPAPAGDHSGATLDLYKLCIKNPASTILFQARGDSMTGVGIFDGDILIVDRSLEVVPGDVVVVSVSGDATVKRLIWQGEHVLLLAENPDYPPIFVEDLEGLRIWGVVTRVIHSLRG